MSLNQFDPGSAGITAQYTSLIIQELNKIQQEEQKILQESNTMALKEARATYDWENTQASHQRQAGEDVLWGAIAGAGTTVLVLGIASFKANRGDDLVNAENNKLTANAYDELTKTSPAGGTAELTGGSGGGGTSDAVDRALKSDLTTKRPYRNFNDANENERFITRRPVKGKWAAVKRFFSPTSGIEVQIPGPARNAYDATIDTPANPETNTKAIPTKTDLISDIKDAKKDADNAYNRVTQEKANAQQAMQVLAQTLSSVGTAAAGDKQKATEDALATQAQATATMFKANQQVFSESQSQASQQFSATSQQLQGLLELQIARGRIEAAPAA